MSVLRIYRVVRSCVAAEQAPTDKTVGKATEATADEKAAIAKDAERPSLATQLYFF